MFYSKKIKLVTSKNANLLNGYDSVIFVFFDILVGGLIYGISIRNACLIPLCFSNFSLYALHTSQFLLSSSVLPPM